MNKAREFWIALQGSELHDSDIIYSNKPKLFGEKYTHVVEISRVHELETRIEKYKKALDLAMYYVEGDATWASLKEKIEDILGGIEQQEKGDPDLGLIAKKETT